MEKSNKEKKFTLAICYDFDKTLSPEDMQAQGYIQSLNEDVSNFWKESNKLASDNDMDQNLAYMYMMSKKSRGKFVFTKEKLKEYGSNVKLFPGVETWFDRINSYGEEKGVEVQHYIISSGLKEMIEGTSIAEKFKKIYASSFYYDQDGVAVWPAQAINFTNKTQFLFRIKKGILDINDQNVNSYFEPDEYKVPFRNMVYIGDSDTDIPCMKLVNINGGHSIGVYDSVTKDKNKVQKMILENRIKYYAEADYRENSELEILVKNIIDRTYINEILEEKYFDCMHEVMEERKNLSAEEIRKEDLINNLQDSRSFINTHAVIKKLSEIESWTEKQKNKLCKIGLENKQVTYILQDKDIKEFYSKICEGSSGELFDKIRKKIEYTV